MMIELFSDIFTARQNALVRQDARVKLAVAGALLVLVLLTRWVSVPLVVACGCLAGAVVLRLPIRLLMLRMLPAVILAGLVMLLKGAFGQGEIAYRFGPVSLHREGLAQGLTIAARVTGATAVVMLLSATTPAHRIFSALRWAGMPATWVDVAMLMYRYIFVLIEQAGDVAAAQRTRLGYSTHARAIRSVGALGGVVCLRSVDQAMRTSQAMTIRGYNGEMPFAPLPRLAGRAKLIMLLAWTACAAALILERWPT